MDSSGSSPIVQLAKLQELDRVRREKEERIRALEQECDAHRTELEKRRAQTVQAKIDLDTHTLQLRELERTYEADGTRMKDRRMRLNRVRNEKELQALRHEIDVGKDSYQQLEELVIQALERRDVLQAAHEQAVQLLAELEPQTDEQVRNNQARVLELQNEIDADRQAREVLRASIDPSLLKRYELIFERRAGSAIANVEDGTCQACHRTLPPQFYNELRRNPSEVKLCPNCHRILLWQPKPVGEEA